MVPAAQLVLEDGTTAAGERRLERLGAQHGFEVLALAPLWRPR
jgi:hypothetical protein